MSAALSAVFWPRRLVATTSRSEQLRRKRRVAKNAGLLSPTQGKFFSNLVCYENLLCPGQSGRRLKTPHLSLSNAGEVFSNLVRFVNLLCL